eukprot:1763964-Rhodomonas_salina.1
MRYVSIGHQYYTLCQYWASHSTRVGGRKVPVRSVDVYVRYLYPTLAQYHISHSTIPYVQPEQPRAAA